MALFPSVDATYTFKGKSHTNLVVSEGDAPSEKWIVASDNAAEPFIYEFGPQYNQTVVLAKGKLVELGAPEYDYNTSRNVTTIKQAGAGSKNVVGVNHHNIYDMRRDRFSGNNQPSPTVITRSYIEVPLFEHAVSDTAAGFAKAMRFGAAYGTNDANILKPGDYVKVGNDGNFVKVDTTADSPFDVVGQVFNIEREVPPAGFLQYYLNMDIPEIEAWLKANGTAPSPGTNPDSSASAYPYGAPYTNKGWLPNFNLLLNPIINKGIPFLTDGYFKAKTVKSFGINDIYDATTNNAGQIESVRIAGKVTLDPATGNATVAADSHNNAIFIKLRNMIDRGATTPITVKYQTGVDAANGNAPVFGNFATKDVVVDMTHYQLNSNVIVVYLQAGQTYQNITIDAALVVDPVAGIPTEWDYQGSVGAVRILLQK
jgi:hypothetical protein